jgi:hypothetical protein
MHKFFALITSYSVGFDGFDKSGARRAAPLGFQELAKANGVAR